EGPLLRSNGGGLEKGRISAGEVALLRRILYAAGGEGNVAITRTEAEALFDINDACRDGQNDPSWTDLFAKAVAASVMTVSGFVPASREDAARREAWLASEPAAMNAVGGFIGRMFGSKPAFGSWKNDGLDDWRALNSRVEAEERSAEVVTEAEATWLAER